MLREPGCEPCPLEPPLDVPTATESHPKAVGESVALGASGLDGEGVEELPADECGSLQRGELRFVAHVVACVTDGFDLGVSVTAAREYQSDGGPTPGQIAELIRSTIPGTDAHAKNYGLLLAANQVKLAPLYDIASILPYDDSDGHKVELAMVLRQRATRSASRRMPARGIASSGGSGSTSPRNGTARLTAHARRVARSGADLASQNS